MVKKFNKVAKTTLAAALMTSAIVPVAYANEVAAFEIKEVIFKDAAGNLVKLTFDQYVDGIVDELFNFTQQLEYVVDAKGNIYKYDDYVDALVDSDFDISAVAAELAANYTPATDLTVVEGNFENGVVVGQTPEENSIETFFYNLAA